MPNIREYHAEFGQGVGVLLLSIKAQRLRTDQDADKQVAEQRRSFRRRRDDRQQLPKPTDQKRRKITLYAVPSRCDWLRKNVSAGCCKIARGFRGGRWK